MTNEEIKAEFSRWVDAGRPDVYVKIGNNAWKKTRIQSWGKSATYIVDDHQAELRKLRIDKPETKFEMYAAVSNRWTATVPTWIPEGKYRVMQELDVDAKVIVWGGGNIKYKEYFSHFDEVTGAICCFSDGATSFSSYDGSVTAWSNWERYKLSSEITLTEEQTKEITEAYNKPEFEYPIFKRNNNTGIVVKFTDLQIGTVVWAGEAVSNIGQVRNTWSKHTDTSAWKDVPYNKDGNLWHGQPVLCWNNEETHCKSIRFYNAISKWVFDWDGGLYGTKYDEYEAIPSDRYDDWMIEAFNKLED